MTMKFEAGAVVGQWTLLQYVRGDKKTGHKGMWLCRCSCGIQREVRVDNLNAGKTHSCGHETGGAGLRLTRTHARTQPDDFHVRAPADPWAIPTAFRKGAQA